MKSCTDQEISRAPNIHLRCSLGGFDHWFWNDAVERKRRFQDLKRVLKLEAHPKNENKSYRNLKHERENNKTKSWIKCSRLRIVINYEFELICVGCQKRNVHHPFGCWLFRVVDVGGVLLSASIHEIDTLWCFSTFSFGWLTDSYARLSQFHFQSNEITNNLLNKNSERRMKPSRKPTSNQFMLCGLLVGNLIKKNFDWRSNPNDSIL